MGGAEGTLRRLISHDRAHTHEVISLTDLGAHGPHLREAGVAVQAIGMRRARFRLRDVHRLRDLIREINPQVVQTWMYHADLLGGLAARLAGYPAVAWSIRNSRLDPDRVARSTRMVAITCALSSRWLPRAIVSCSKQAAAAHVALGYDARKMVVVSNGFDASALNPDPTAVGKLRATLAADAGTMLLGTVARWDLLKDHRNLVAALQMMDRARRVPWRAVLVGPGMTDDNAALLELLTSHGVRERVHLLGAREDLANVYGTLDLHVLPSIGEAFPNVLAEAMACGTPCVSTDVGDAALIIGDTGWVVPAQDPLALAEAIRDAAGEVSQPAVWQRRKERARARISDQFGMKEMLEGFGRVWHSVAESK